MSDFPELDLFEEIIDISISPDFVAFTKQEFNNTWSYYQTEASQDPATPSPHETPKTKSYPTTTTATPDITTPLNNPERDSWDPRLLNINLGTYNTDLEIPEMDTTDIDNDLSVSGLLDQEYRLISPLDNSGDLNRLCQDVSLLEDNNTSTRTLSPNSVNMRSRVRPLSPRSLRQKFFPKEATNSSLSLSRRSQQKLIRKGNVQKLKHVRSIKERPLKCWPKDSHVKLNMDASDKIVLLRGKNKKLKKQVHFERKKLSDARQLINKLKMKMKLNLAVPVLIQV